ncbi:MAG: flavodoxin family protein [Athalassotoga sp.]|uniref:flavodoxin family protein n=1 Tax=Athalassotoga sp. TaxID=2022597 RepID=UPI003D03A0F3
MKYSVVFFSRTGNSKRVAEKISKALGVKPIEIIQESPSFKGLFGYLKAGYYSMRNKSVKIKISENYKDTDRYIVVSPLWAGKPANATVEFLKLVPPGKVTLVLTCIGSDTDKIVNDYESKNGKFKSHYGIVKKLKNEEKVIDEILKNLQK